MSAAALSSKLYYNGPKILIKWLLLFVGAVVFFRWMKRKSLSQAGQSPTDSPLPKKASKLATPEQMVQCHYCQVHLPKSEAFANDGRFYCSQTHGRQIDQQGWIGQALWRASPNFDERPDGSLVDLVLIHHISLPPGGFKASAMLSEVPAQFIVEFFQNRLNPNGHPYFAQIANERVSSHFVIARDGQIIQLVSTQSRAWHAGVSRFGERERCNDFSLGIELEGDGETPFEEAQYKALAGLNTAILEKYPQVVFAGHSDVAPGRKMDPGVAFDWSRFQKNNALSIEKFPFGVQSR